MKTYFDKLLKEFKGRDDSLLLDNSSFLVATGENWETWLRTYGEIRGTYKGINLYNQNFDEYFETNQDIQDAEQQGTLELWNNNWFELEIVFNGEYLELGDSAVVFSIEEGERAFKQIADEFGLGGKNGN